MDVMNWFRRLFAQPRNTTNTTPTRRVTAKTSASLLDEAFLRRLERLMLEARSTLRGVPTAGEHPSRQQMPMTVFSDHRPYSAGDDYRLVDWNAYARHEQIVVKLGEADQSINVHIILDLSRSMDWGTPNKLLVARQLSAAIGALALANNDRLRIAPFSSGLLTPFGPAQGKTRLIDSLRYLNQLQPAQRTSLAAAVASHCQAHEQGGLIVICSDLLAEPAEGLIAALRHVPAPRWQTLVIQLTDPWELKPDLQGALDLEDAETGQKIALTIDEDTLIAYRRNLELWQNQIRAACQRYGATLAQIATNWPLERQIIPYLHLRRVIRP